MEDMIAFIGGQIKEYFQKAVLYIQEKQYENARECYEKAAVLCKLTNYNAGIGMVNLSMANLEVLLGNYKESLKLALSSENLFESCEDKKNAADFIKKLCQQIVQEGMKLEKSQQYPSAIELFETALPYLNQKRQQILKQEIDLLKKKEQAPNGQ